MRVTQEQKDLVLRAATANGSSLSSFAVSSLLDAAAKVLAQADAWTLSAKEFDEFAASLNQPHDERFLKLLRHKPVWRQ